MLFLVCKRKMPQLTAPPHCIYVERHIDSAAVILLFLRTDFPARAVRDALDTIRIPTRPSLFTSEVMTESSLLAGGSCRDAASRGRRGDRQVSRR